MFLQNSELLFSMEGGCFDSKKYDNEVFIQNCRGQPVATLLLGQGDTKDQSRVMYLNVLEEHVDKALLLVFSMYASLTL